MDVSSMGRIALVGFTFWSSLRRFRSRACMGNGEVSVVGDVNADVELEEFLCFFASMT